MGKKKASIRNIDMDRYKGNLFGFEMGPSVKFVSAIIDAFSNKKMGVRGGFGKRPDFFRIFFSATFPYKYK